MLSWGVALGAAHALGALATSRTFFQPDEYWQTLEIAHRIVFGYGYQTWEWRGEAPIRSVVHPALFVPLYAVLKETGLDSSAYLMVGVLANAVHGTGTVAGSDRHGRRRCVFSPRAATRRRGARVRLGK